MLGMFSGGSGGEFRLMSVSDHCTFFVTDLETVLWGGFNLQYVELP